MNTVINKYKIHVHDILRNLFGDNIDMDHADKIIDNMINDRYTDNDVRMINNYKEKEVNLTMGELIDYIYDRKPIMTAAGTLFNQQDEELQGVLLMTKEFLDERGVLKKEMYKYIKGSEKFNMYNLLQLLAKIDANSLYGAIGQCNSIFYNIHVASSITIQSQIVISTAAATFESFLYNNIKFRNLSEVLTFINNVKKDTINMKYNDYDIIDIIPTHSDCFIKVMGTCGNGYVPNNSDMNIIWDTIQNLNQYELNRLFYYNNLFEFIKNKYIENKIIGMLHDLKRPYMNPNIAPSEIEDDLKELSSLFIEYVFYNHPYRDVIDRIKFLPRQAVLILDTDSNILYLDPWYRTVKNMLNNIDTSTFNITKTAIDIIDVIEPNDEFGDYDPEDIIEIRKNIYDYDFQQDSIVERPYIEDPFILGGSNDGLRYSIINIICYALSEIIDLAMKRFTKLNNSMEMPYSKLYLYMKNEYLFKALALPPAKRNYAAIQEVQEGKFIGCMLAITGLPITKSSMNKNTQKRLKQILKDDILNTENDIDQLTILKKLKILEHEIITSLKEGRKDYYTPLTSKSIDTYSDPMKMSQIKSIIVWNEIKEDWQEGFDIKEQNGFFAVSVKIDKKNVEKIKDVNENIYYKLLDILEMKGFSSGIKMIAVPDNETLPEWCREFIDYNKIIQSNLTPFSSILNCSCLSDVNSKSVPYTNIVQF